MELDDPDGWYSACAICLTLEEVLRTIPRGPFKLLLADLVRCCFSSLSNGPSKRTVGGKPWL